MSYHEQRLERRGGAENRKQEGGWDAEKGRCSPVGAGAATGEEGGQWGVPASGTLDFRR